MANNNKKYCSNESDTDRPLRLEHRFLVLRKLGQGTYGKVQLALNKETNEEVAVKTIKKAKIENEEDMLRIRREIHIMSSLQHPHIIHIHEVFETRQKIVIVMQYASGGELYDYLGCHQTLPEDEARRLFRQIASAVYYCHKNQICHRDLKLENILLDEEGNAKIADFGLSNIFDDKRRMNTFCGSPLYASPEIVKGTPYKGPEVDCWSLGVLLYTLVYGTMPFDGRSFKELVSQISEGRYEEPIYRSNASSLIRWLLTPDISKRATIEDVCKDSWINETYDIPLLEVAENMQGCTKKLPVGLHQERINSTKACLEKSSKNGCENSIFKKTTTQLEERAEKITSLLTRNLENIIKINEAVAEKRKTNFYEQITNYDVRFVLNKIIAAVEASFKVDTLPNNLSDSTSNVPTTYVVQTKGENASEKIESAYIIPIFEVTSTIPKERGKNMGCNNKNSESDIVTKIPSKTGFIKILKSKVAQQEQAKEINSENFKNMQIVSKNGRKNMIVSENRCKGPLTTNTPSLDATLLKNSQKSIYSLKISEQLRSSKKDVQTQNQQDNPPSRHPSQKNKLVNDNLPCGQKQPSPFMRTKNNVLSLARLLSLNYEKIMRNSFRVPACKKKLPGKITIPPTFDPNNPPTTTKKTHEEKKELLIFPTVSVSENKVKIEKKIEKIKKAALNKNLIIRSDSKTRMRIEKYIRSQVKRIQDLVREEQRSLQASLEHLDEQSLRDMSEMYYCTYGSENTDSGIANAEDEESFCFLCSKPNTEKGTSGIFDSFILDSIKKGFLYTSNHLHIPRAKEHNKWGYSLNNMNLEFGSLNRCKSEIQFPHDYLNYISPSNNSDLNKRIYPKQVIQRNSIGNTKCFLTVPSTIISDSSDLCILRSASDSAVLELSKNTFDIVKLNTEYHNNDAENYNFFPQYLQQTQASGCSYFEATDYKPQSSATESQFICKSQILDKDDGIGDSNDSFQSYIETMENFENDSEITRSMSSHSYINFTKNKNKPATNPLLSRKILTESHLKQEYESEWDDLDRESTDQRANIEDILDSDSWIGTLDDDVYSQQKEKGRGLRRRNTMSCLPRKSETGEDFNLSNSSTEFENYLWNAYKEHLLQNRNDSEYFSSPNLNYYSPDRKTKFKSRDSKSMDYINTDTNNDFMSKEFSHRTYPDQESGEINSTFKKVFKHSNIIRNRPERPVSRLNRTKSLCSETLTDNDMDDIIKRIRQERKLSHCNTKLDSNGSFMSNFVQDMEKIDQRRKKNVGSNRRHSTSTVSQSKRNKSEYKKSFLQLLALKRIEEAEKELDKAPKTNLLNNVEDNSGSLLEALKTHGYKSVISQRFQDTGDDVLDTFHMKYLKSPRKLRAELARLNYMYYEPLPRYTLGPFEENNYYSDDLDYARSLLSTLATMPYYDRPCDFRQQTKQSVYDWLDTTQIDEYINSLRSDTFYNSDESTPTPETKRYSTHWSKENYRSFDDESTSESQDTIEDLASNGTYSICPKNKEISVSNDTNNDRFQTNSFYSDDERQEESVHDRIWRKSFYSRFNNRALSRKERLSYVKPELSESRLGFLNNAYSSTLKPGYDKSERLQGDGSNKSFNTKRLQKHSQSFDKFESRGSIKNKCVKTTSEKEIGLENREPYSYKTLKKVYNAREKEEPEH